MCVRPFETKLIIIHKRSWSIDRDQACVQVCVCAHARVYVLFFQINYH